MGTRLELLVLINLVLSALALFAWAASYWRLGPPKAFRPPLSEWMRNFSKALTRVAFSYYTYAFLAGVGVMVLFHTSKYWYVFVAVSFGLFWFPLWAVMKDGEEDQ